MVVTQGARFPRSRCHAANASSRNRGKLSQSGKYKALLVKTSKRKRSVSDEGRNGCQ